MIQVVEGRGVGAGKTCYVVTRVITHVASGGTVYYSSTLRLKPDKIIAYIARHYGVEALPEQMVEVPHEDVFRIHEVTPPGSDEMPVLIVIDEAQRALNSRDWNDPKKRALFDWACESRHDNNDLIFISQNALNIDKQILRLVTYITRVRNMTNTKIAGIKWPFKQFMVKLVDGDGKTEMERFMVPFNNEIFDCYVSKSMGGAHKRLHGQVVGKRVLKKVVNKRRTRLMRFLLVILVAALVCAGGCGYKLYRMGGIPGLTSTPAAAAKVVSAPSPAPSSPAGPSAVPTKKDPAYRVIRETYTGSSEPNVLVTKEGGTYMAGEMSIHGFVKAVRCSARVARIEDGDGATWYIVAVDRPRPETTGTGGGLRSVSSGVLHEKAASSANEVEKM